MSDPTCLNRCRIVPLPEQQVAFEIDGRQRLRWHFGAVYPRPFFYPLIGPSGHPLTRMGHPGAPDHDHHRSIWFAHEDVVGCNYWTDATTARVRQRRWLCYQDADDEAVMAVDLEWFDGHDARPVLRHQLIAAARPLGDGETLLELQSTFRPTATQLEFGKTNFGFLGVRVARSISVHFGAGMVSDSEGRQGEPAIFGRAARWMDYSGPVGTKTDYRIEGITYHDHPSNPHYPSRWHVRRDGWMLAAPCMQETLITTQAKPLVLRYLLHAHAGPANQKSADEIAAQFAKRPALQLARARGKHVQFEVRRGV